MPKIYEAKICFNCLGCSYFQLVVIGIQDGNTSILTSDKLKSDSYPPKKIVLFASMKAL